MKLFLTSLYFFSNLVYVDLRYHDGFAIRQNAVTAAKAGEQQSSEQMPTALPETE